MIGRRVPVVAIAELRAAIDVGLSSSERLLKASGNG